MKEKQMWELNQDEYELLCFYRQLSETRKTKFMELVKTLDILVERDEKTKDKNTQ